MFATLGVLVICFSTSEPFMSNFEVVAGEISTELKSPYIHTPVIMLEILLFAAFVGIMIWGLLGIYEICGPYHQDGGGY